jgi:hypothetical protein
MTTLKLTTNQIIEIHNRQSGVVMRKITSKYMDVINEVKFYIASGWDKTQAINYVLFDEMDFMFTSNDERSLLKMWMENSMKS